MSDPQNFGPDKFGLEKFGPEKFGPEKFGLDQLGQRLHAMSEADQAPVVEPRLRPYQGAPLPVGNSSNGQAAIPPASNVRSIPPYEAFENFERLDEFHVSPTSASPTQSSFSAGTGTHPPSPLGSSLGNGSAWVHQAAPENIIEESAADSTAPKALTTPAEDPNSSKSGFQRAIDAVRPALPIVQKLLPLLDGNFASLMATLAGQQAHHPAPPPVKVDLDPLERGLADLRTSHRDLRGQVQEQNATLKRVEDQLERVREATDRNTLEQQELVEDLRSVGNRISTFAIIGILLLAISLGLNIYFLVQLQHILR